MKKIFSLQILFFVISIIPVFNQTKQYASSVINVSSEYGITNSECSNSWSACRTLGEPNVYPNFGDFANAWASATQGSQREFLELGFSTPQQVDSIFIYETYNPGAIDTVYLRNVSNKQWIKVWDGTAFDNLASNNIFKIGIPTTSFLVDAIRIGMNSPLVTGWNEIDAVGISLDPVSIPFEQYASSVINVSSEYGITNNECSNSWSACRTLGEPNVYPNFGDFANAWASATQGSQREFLELGFSTPQKVASILIYETYNPGAIDTIYLRNIFNNEWVKVWEGTAFDNPLEANIFSVKIPLTPYFVDAIRIAINSPAVSGWNEIDAIKISNKFIPLSIEEININEALRIHPNPNNGTFTVDFGQHLQGETIKLYNCSGQEVLYFSNIIDDSFNIESQLKKGIYFLETTTKNDRLVTRVLIE